MPAITSIWSRITTAINKLLFCYRATATPASFVRLLVNTKSAAWPRKDPVPFDLHAAIGYSFRLHKQPRRLYLRTYAGDLQIFYDVFWRNIYQLPAPLLLRAKTIVDLGAHVGMAAAYFNLHCPNATIYCVEADESNYALLKQNLQPQIAKGAIIAQHTAISNTNDTVYLQKSKHSYNSQLADTVTNYPVPGMRMQQFVQSNQLTHIDIIKIDIEGAESFLLQDDTEWLSITDTIIVEIHGEANWQLFNTTVTRYGFRIKQLDIENESLYIAHRNQ